MSDFDAAKKRLEEASDAGQWWSTFVMLGFERKVSEPYLAFRDASALLDEVERLKTLYEGAVHDWRNACELMNKAEAELAAEREESAENHDLYMKAVVERDTEREKVERLRADRDEAGQIAAEATLGSPNAGSRNMVECVRDLRAKLTTTEAEVERLRSLLEANIPPRTYGSLQEEVDFLRRDVASLQANKHNLITRLGAAEAEVKALRGEGEK